MARNDWLTQYLADITNTPVERPALLETTALGAARLAGLQAGVFNDLADLQDAWVADQAFIPSMDESIRQSRLSTWRRAVEVTIGFAKDSGKG
jgi:glycerol kinase